VDVSACNKKGTTVLHHIAQWGDERLLDMLVPRAHRFNHLNSVKLDGQGRTARDVMQSRLNSTTEFNTRFEDFLSNIEAFNATTQMESVLPASGHHDTQFPHTKHVSSYLPFLSSTILATGILIFSATLMVILNYFGPYVLD
jgi:hypothetical protein